jgi:hypothetical protein
MKDLKRYKVKVKIYNRVIGPAGDPIGISDKSYIREFIIYQPDMEAAHEWVKFIHNTGMAWIGEWKIDEVK